MDWDEETATSTESMQRSKEYAVAYLGEALVFRCLFDKMASMVRRGRWEEGEMGGGRDERRAISHYGRGLRKCHVGI